MGDYKIIEKINSFGYKEPLGDFKTFSKIREELYTCDTWEKEKIVLDILGFDIHGGDFYEYKIINKESYPSQKKVLKEKWSKINREDDRFYIRNLFKNDGLKNLIMDHSYLNLKKSDNNQKDIIRLANKTIAITGKQESNILYVDIDKTDGLEYLNKIIKKFGGVKPIFIEQSIIGRVHSAFTLSKNIDDVILKNIQDELRNTICKNIDIRTSKKPMRLPGSHSYKTGYLNDTHEFIPHKTRDEYLDSILNRNDVSTIDINVFKNQSKKNCSKNNIDIEKNLIKVLEEYIDNPKNQRNMGIHENSTCKVKDNSSYDFSRFKYGEGTRNDKMTKLISHCLHNGITLDEAFDIHYKLNDDTSKDIRNRTKESYKLLFTRSWKSLHRTFNKTNKKVYNTKKDNNGFISNTPRLDEQCNKYIDLYIKSELKESIKKEYVRENKQNQVLKYSTHLLKEILGYALYKAEILEKDKFKNYYNRNQYSIRSNRGFQISREHLCLIKKHYNMKNIDVIKLYNTIINTSLFDQIKVNNKGWCTIKGFNHCKQYNIKSIGYFLSNNKILKKEHLLINHNLRSLKVSLRYILQSNNIYIDYDSIIYNKCINSISNVKVTKEYNYINNIIYKVTNMASKQICRGSPPL